MSNKLIEGALNVLAPAATPIISAKVADLLRKISPKQTRKEVLIQLNSGVNLLLPLTDKTNTKIDDTAIDAIKDAIMTVAVEDEITLP